MKFGDVVKVDYVSSHGNHYNWVGMIMGIYGHKLEMLINGKIDIWRMSDLTTMGAEIISESQQ